MPTARIKWVSCDVDARGNVRCYFRKPGQPKFRIRAPWLSPEWWSIYIDLMEGREPELLKAKQPGVDNSPHHPQPEPDSFRAFVVAYKQSPEFQRLGSQTKRTRGWVYDRVAEVHGEDHISKVDRLVIRALRDAKQETPEAANKIIKALRPLFDYAVALKKIMINEAKLVPYLPPNNPDGHYTWEREDVEQFRACHAVGSTPRLALELLLLTGVRRSDVIKLGPQHVRDGWLTIHETKGAAKDPKVTVVPLLPELAKVIAASETGDMVFLLNSYGRSFTNGSFGNKMRQWCDEAGLPRCTAHGLRKAGATFAAEGGATAFQLMAIFGWKSVKQASRYVEKANRRKLAGDSMRFLVQDSTTAQQLPQFPAAFPVPGGKE